MLHSPFGTFWSGRLCRLLFDLFKGTSLMATCRFCSCSKWKMYFKLCLHKRDYTFTFSHDRSLTVIQCGAQDIVDEAFL